MRGLQIIITGRIKSNQPNPSSLLMDWLLYVILLYTLLHQADYKGNITSNNDDKQASIKYKMYYFSSHNYICPGLWDHFNTDL